MNNITPGTLCIINRGPMFGTSLTAERLAEKGEVEALLCKEFGLKKVRLGDNCPIWKTDKLVAWRSLAGRIASIPYEAQYNLTPIPPLADPLDVKQEEELKV
jgi:hypothetical protein